MISSPEHPENHYIYSVETNLGSGMFCNDISNEQHDYENIIKKEKEGKHVFLDKLEMVEEKWCNMNFDGVVSKEGTWASICITGLEFEYRSFSYKLYFDCTNNVAKYEALILGLKMIK